MEEDSEPLNHHSQPSHHLRLPAQGKGSSGPSKLLDPWHPLHGQTVPHTPKIFPAQAEWALACLGAPGALPSDRSLLVYSTVCPRGQAPRLVVGGSAAYREVLTVARLANH